MLRPALIVLAAAGVFAAAEHRVYGHHSTAEFDYSKTVVLAGEVKEVQWMNPHCYIQLLVPGADGAPVEWAVEIGAPMFNMRMGWRADSVKEGDDVTLNMVPARRSRVVCKADGQESGE